MTLRSRSLALMAPLLLLAAATRAHANCGAEGCPLAPRGPESPGGRLAFHVRYQSVDQDRFWDGNHSITTDEAIEEEGGLGHILEQETRTHTTLFDVDARVLPRLGLTLSLPYVDRLHRHALVHHAGYLIESTWHMKGLGDAMAVASWDLTDASSSLGGFTVHAGVKLPTGETEVEEIDGEAPEPSARPGTGSTDWMGGLSYRRSLHLPGIRGASAATPLALSVNARVNGAGTESYRMGNEWNASAGVAYPLVPRLRLLAQLNASQHARDEAGETDAEPHETGSTSVFAAPGLQLDLVPGMTLFGYDQFRLYRHTNGPQLVSPYHLSFGLAWSMR